MDATRGWQLPVGTAAVTVAFVGAVLAATPAASSQTESDSVCDTSELTVSGPPLGGCGGDR